MRILPHHQDTGGFFVAVLEKVRLLPWESLVPLSQTKPLENTTQSCNNESSCSVNPEGTNVSSQQTGSPERKRRKTTFFGYKEDPFVFFKEDEPVWPSIRYV